MSDIPAADIKNWSKIYNTTTGRVEVPATILGAGNTTKGEFLHVKTIDVRSLFCAVTLTDFPIPTRGQTTSSGSGFTPNTPYQGQAAGCSFNFTAPATVGAVVVGFDIDPPTVTTNVSVGSKTMIPRIGATNTGLAGIIPPPDRSIASLNARNTLAAKLLTAPPAPYAAAAGATNAAAAADAIAAANINELVNLTVPAPTLTTLQNTYNSAKVASDAAQAAAEAEKIRDPDNATDPDNTTLNSTAAVTSQATASALDALQTAQAASSAQSTANANASANAFSSAVDAAKRAAAILGATPQYVASEAANAAANAAAAQVVTTPATFAINITQPPSWLIGALVQKQMPNAGNSQTFYVIKGTTLTLYADDLVQIPAPILTVQINADSKFEYFNGAWTRVD